VTTSATSSGLGHLTGEDRATGLIAAASTGSGPHASASASGGGGEVLASAATAAASGDRAAMMQIYDHTAPTALNLLRALTDQEQTAQDLLVVTFAECWRQAARRRPGMSVTAWVLSIAVATARVTGQRA